MMLKSIKMWTGLSSDDYSGAETKQEGTADQGWSWWVQREQATVSRSQRDELQDRIERRMQRIESGGSDPVLADAADWRSPVAWEWRRFRLFQCPCGPPGCDQPGRSLPPLAAFCFKVK